MKYLNRVQLLFIIFLLATSLFVVVKVKPERIEFFRYYPRNFLIKSIIYYVKHFFIVGLIYFSMQFIFTKSSPIFIFFSSITVMFTIIIANIIPKAFSFSPAKISLWRKVFPVNILPSLIIFYIVAVFLITFLNLLIFYKNQQNINIQYKILIFSAITIIATTIYAYDINIIVTKYEVQIENLSDNLKGLRIVHISDLHSTIHGKDQKVLIDKIKEAKPDIIVMSGDIFDDRVDFEGTRLMLEGIKDVAPIYYSIGNHEFWSNDFYKSIEAMKNFGVTILDNKSTEITLKNEKIIISGLDDPNNYYYKENPPSPQKALEEMDIPSTNLKILLSHRPDFVNIYKKSNYDLIFSGHAHGGQIRIPFLFNGLFAPNQGFFPKYAGDAYGLEGKYLVVSRGLSISALPRIFNPPEIVLLVLK